MTDPDLADAIDETLPPASATHGNPGHETATELSRGARLLRLRAARIPYEQIAQMEGYSDRSSARHALMRALDRHEAENAAQLRLIENEALDADERALRAIISDLTQTPAMRIRAVDARTRLSARRSRLNGLDAPVQVQISAGVREQMEAAFGELEEVVSQIVAGQVIGAITDEPYDAPLEA